MKLFNINSRPKKWLITFGVLSLLFGGAAVLSQYVAVNLFGFTSGVHREQGLRVAPDPYISISSADIPLEVYTHDGSNINIDYVGASPLAIDLDEHGLKIGREESFLLSLFTKDKLNYKLCVGLPDVVYREIKLSSASGNITVENLSADSITVTSRLGGIKAAGLDGIVFIGNTKASTEIMFDKFSEPCFIETDSGDVRVFMPSDLEPYGVKLDFLSDNGTFTSDYFRKEYDGHKGDLYLSTGDNPIRFTITTSTGNVEFYAK